MKIVYVVLHYLAVKETIDCVQSILTSTSSSVHETSIVIVDNASTNDSYDELKEKLESIDKVYLLKNICNMGFAKGNNVGFICAKYQLSADFIVMVNNDTLLNQTDFNEILVDKYIERKYAVLGPDIITKDGCHQNPGRKQNWSYKELNAFRLKKRIRLLLSYIGLEKKASKAAGSDQDIYDSETNMGDVEHTILHGACLIFSPNYIKRFDGLYDKTFLYWEEDILKLRCDMYDLLMLYTSDLYINHLEDISTNMIKLTDEQKKRRKFKELIRSCKVYESYKKKLDKKKKIIKIVSCLVGKIKKTNEYSIDMDMPMIYLLGVICKRMGMLIKGKIKSLGLLKTGRTVFMGSHVLLKCKSKISLGTGVTIENNVYMDGLSKTGLSIGDGCSIGSGTIIRCSGNYKELGVGFRMGNHSSLADNCFVGASGGVFIGDDVIGGQNIRFHASNHNYVDKDILIRKQGVNMQGIHIGNNCWIGAGVVFCDGVNIGDGCVIGANAVVTKSFPENSVIVGSPARLIKTR